MTMATIEPARADHLLRERAAASEDAQRRADAPGAPPAGAQPPQAALVEPVSKLEHAAMVSALVGELIEIGGQDPDPKAVVLATWLTYPANKRWGRLVEDVPPVVAIGMAGLGLVLLAKACGVIGAPPVPPPPTAPTPAGQGRAP